ncbi:MAG: hypothetical protein HY294_08275 [Candidatus Rokubacteria bacterium]|nr:hypothetical protein [Candidatus Rokubacteria bacterium]
MRQTSLVGAALALLLVLVVPLGGAAQQWTSPGPVDKVEAGVNWTSLMITATAIGVAPPQATSPAQGRALAITAGTILARQELLAVARGMTIDSRTTVRDVMVQASITEARVTGLIRGAQVVNVKDIGGGAVEVTVAVPATGEFADVVIPRPAPAAPPTPRPPVVSPPPPAPAAPAPPIYTGVVIDARGLGVHPAMAPKITSEGGQEVYGFAVVDRNWVIQQGMAGYSKDLAAAQAHDRVANRPLTVKAVAASGANKTDVVISNPDAQLLIGSGAHLSFLEKARVMLVVD